MNRVRDYDAIVIGGGPAGATAAAVLAGHRRRVVLLEKEKFPRYHVGESLMPYCYFPLERIGVIDQIKSSHFPKKYSVQFASLNGRISQPFYFFQHFDHEASTTWQVNRSEFDQILLDNARVRGAEVLEETRAEQIVRDGDTVVGVRALGNSGERLELRAPITIDASGRDALAIARNEWRIPDQKLKKIALWTYYRGGLRDAGLDENATTVAYLPEKGWFWYIPLPNDIISVGLVAERDYLYTGTRDPAAIMDRERVKNPWVEQHLAPATQFGKYYATSEFSYRSRHCAADGLVLAGDAFAFLDPVFSSGVFLALRSGELAADAAHAALEKGDVSAGQFRAYGEEMCQGIEAMRKVVYAFYDHDFNFRELFQAHPEVRGDLTDCLIGNLFREFDELFAAVGKFARLPEPLPHGEPLAPLACASSN
ncbi:MAG TPA: tryptophan 7-halogenase [Armatimonadota bacterium]|nr:tryptophan 7-halogenase [Armatimonadota bacterium]